MKDSAPISGRASQLKPWQIAAIGVTVIAGVVILLPMLSHLTEKKKTEDTSAAMYAANSGNAGEPWHPPAFPEPSTPVVYKPPPSQPPAPPTTPAATPALMTTNPLIGSSGPKGPGDYRMFGQSQQPGQVPQGQSGQMAGAAPQAQRAAADGSMASLLKPTEMDGYTATRMVHPWATIEQGRIIQCNSVTPMNSELPGFVKAKVTYDEPGVDGTTTLIEHNSTIFGEISHGLINGQDRLFVLWRSVRTPAPNFVRITLNSPASDELGESGLPGDINHHVWKRIGAAVMLSGIETLGQGLSQFLGGLSSKGNNNGSSGSGLNFYSFQGQGSSLGASMLQHTVDIPDTLHRDQALGCSIFVGGDLDFNSVYGLRRKNK